MTKKQSPIGRDRARGNNKHESSHRASAAEKADTLIESINTRVSEIKQALRGLEQEKAAIEKQAQNEIAALDVRIGRLNAFLVRMGGGGAAAGAVSAGSGNGKGRPQRMTAASLEKAKTMTMELAGRHGQEGLRRGDVMDSLGISAAQTTKVFNALIEEHRLKAIGEKAGRRYYLVQ